MTDFGRYSALSAGLVKAIAFGVIGVSLAACGSSGGLLGSQDQTTNVAAPKPQPAIPGKAQITIAPVVGAPTNISKKLADSLSSAAQAKNVSVQTASNGKSDYTVRGYVVAAPDAKGTKLSYIWDVTDPGGKRKKRFVGEQVVQGKKPRDPWALVNDQVIGSIAQKTATDLVQWLPKKSSAVTTTAEAPQPVSTPGTAAAVPATAQPTQAPITQVKTGETRPIPVKVMTVEGAPGDGRRSLTAAIRNQLRGRGLTLASADQRGQFYTVRGQVKMGAIKGESQSIAIDWKVVAPTGENIGTVNQANQVAKGSLDGRWGGTAEAAAASAAEGIVKLIPKKDRPAGKST